MHIKHKLTKSLSYLDGAKILPEILTIATTSQTTDTDGRLMP